MSSETSIFRTGVEPAISKQLEALLDKEHYMVLTDIINHEEARGIGVMLHIAKDFGLQFITHTLVNDLTLRMSIERKRESVIEKITSNLVSGLIGGEDNLGLRSRISQLFGGN